MSIFSFYDSEIIHSFSSLDPIKSLLTKLGKCYRDMHKAYHMIESVAAELKKYRDGIDN